MRACRRADAWLRCAILAAALYALAGCSTLGYYAHVAHGQASLLVARRSIDALVADPSTEPALRERLRDAQDARRFASDRIGLSRNRSYTSYVELGRAYVTWNVFAAPEFSVDARTQCYPFAGCVAYRGYFDRARAEREAHRLARTGDDTHVEGAAAYSTLGWFADPVLSSMLRWSDDELDGVIFHELAHQAIYVRDDTAFNESYASFVQDEGVREWRAARGLPPPDAAERDRDRAFSALVLDLRERLRALYAREADAEAMRAAKRAEIDAFRVRYTTLRDTRWNGNGAYDAWVAAPINNARLLPFGLYDEYQSAFARVFAEAGGCWPAFFERVRALAKRSPADRGEALRRLQTDPPDDAGQLPRERCGGAP